MGTIVRFVRETMLWIILLPACVTFVGAASNQAVLIANGDKFPVLINDVKQAQAEVTPSGMIDDTHCLMTRQTHLNALADIFDLGNIYSIGDMLIEFGRWLGTFSFFVWIALVTRRLHERQTT